jgi:hypothetical protein
MEDLKKHTSEIRTMKLIKSLLFADDTALLANGSNIEALTDFVNDEFHKVVYYFKKKSPVSSS